MPRLRDLMEQKRQQFWKEQEQRGKCRSVGEVLGEHDALSASRIDWQAYDNKKAAYRRKVVNYMVKCGLRREIAEDIGMLWDEHDPAGKREFEEFARKMELEN